MSTAQELYDREIAAAAEALDGADRKVGKCRSHLADAEAWQAEAKANLARVQELGSAAFKSDDVRAEAGVASAGAGAGS